MTRSRIARFLVATAPALVVGCDHSGISIDDWGTSGYARIEGRVTRANGTPLANGSVWYSCGADSPGEFGGSGPTGATGRYVLNINAPAPHIIPASGALFCRLSAAPQNAPIVVSVERSVPFSATAEARPATIVDLTEP